jgi:hypothetical protein
MSVNIARATVEIIKASELRKRRKIGGFLGADRMIPTEYFILLRMEPESFSCIEVN